MNQTSKVYSAEIGSDKKKDRNIAMVWMRAVRRSRAEHGAPLPKTARLLLLTLATYMNADGVAWPTQEMLAEDMQATRKTVSDSVELAVKAGWIRITPHRKKPGQAWRNYVYHASYPEGYAGKEGGVTTTPASEADPSFEDTKGGVAVTPARVGVTGESRSSNGDKAGVIDDGSWGNPRQKVVCPLPINSSSISSANSPFRNDPPSPLAKGNSASPSDRPIESSEQLGEMKSARPPYVPDVKRIERLRKAIKAFPEAGMNELMMYVRGSTIREVRIARSA